MQTDQSPNQIHSQVLQNVEDEGHHRAFDE